MISFADDLSLIILGAHNEEVDEKIRKLNREVKAAAECIGCTLAENTTKIMTLYRSNNAQTDPCETGHLSIVGFSFSKRNIWKGHVSDLITKLNDKMC